MRCVGCEELLASFCAETGVGRADEGIAERNVGGALEFLQHAWQVVFLGLAGLGPWQEPSLLSVVPVGSHELLRPDKQNLAVQTDHAAVVANIAVLHWHTHINDDAMAGLVLEKPR